MKANFLNPVHHSGFTPTNKFIEKALALLAYTKASLCVILVVGRNYSEIFKKM